MNSNIDTIRQKIDAAIVEVQEQGWEITPRLWIDRNKKQCCPMGAVLVAANSTPSWLFGIRAAEILDTSVDNVTRFLSGFDCRELIDIKIPDPYVSLGREYRRNII